MAEMRNLVLKVVDYSTAATEIQAIRQAVFQREQQVEPSLDFDGLDEIAFHVVAYQDDQLVGTARLRFLSDRLAKIERVAVLSTHRGQGIGQAVMEAAIAFLEQQGIAEIKLNAQVQTRSFYEKLGFQPRGEEFKEAGILHIEMYRSQNQN
jgi:predicted GNAT family N-acyltransferase